MQSKAGCKPCATFIALSQADCHIPIIWAWVKWTTGGGGIWTQLNKSPRAIEHRVYSVGYARIEMRWKDE